MCRVAGSVFKILQTSSPDIFGNIKSRMIKSGLASRALARPAEPSETLETIKPPALRKCRVKRSTTSFSSSTTRMHLLDTASMSAEIREELLRFARDRGLYPGLLVQDLCEFLQTGHDLRRFA